MLKGLSDLANLPKMMKVAQEMQQRMEKLQAELEKLEVEGESGAGLVKARVSAKGRLIGLDIDPSIFHPDEKTVIEDLIVAAVRDAQLKGEDKARKAMDALKTEIGIPLDSELPF